MLMMKGRESSTVATSTTILFEISPADVDMCAANDQSITRSMTCSWTLAAAAMPPAAKDTDLVSVANAQTKTTTR